MNIVHADALNIIKNECDKQFLIAQRKKWKQDCMLEINRKNKDLDKPIEKRSINIMERRKIVHVEIETLGNLFFIDDLCLHNIEGF